MEAAAACLAVAEEGEVRLRGVEVEEEVLGLPLPRLRKGLPVEVAVRGVEAPRAAAEARAAVGVAVQRSPVAVEAEEGSQAAVARAEAAVEVPRAAAEARMEAGVAALRVPPAARRRRRLWPGRRLRLRLLRRRWRCGRSRRRRLWPVAYRAFGGHGGVRSLRCIQSRRRAAALLAPLA